MKRLIIILTLFFIKSSFSQSKLENLGSTINSKNSEVRPVLSADGKYLYFVVDNNIINGANKTQKKSQEVWCAELSNLGFWKQSFKCEEPLNVNNRDNAVFWSSVDGSKILIRGTFENGKYQGRGFSFCKKMEKGWSQPEAIKIKGYNSLSVDNYDGAFLTIDGKTLLLYLSEEKNSWLNDIYVSQQESENEWSFPQKIISDSISVDDYDEIAPYVAADGVTMYFSSDRPGGHGGYDIWMTKRLDDTWLHWSSPINVGDSVNSDKWEAYFTLDAKAEYGYLATTRNSIGGIDLCKIKLTENQKPQAVTLFQCKVFNAENNELLSNVEVTSEIVGSNNPMAVQIENQGFKTILPYGNKYIITAKGEGFETVTEAIDLSNLAPYQEMQKDLFMHPVKKEIQENLSVKDSIVNDNKNQPDKVPDTNIVNSKNNVAKKTKSQKQVKQNIDQDKPAKSIDISKKEQDKKKVDSDVVIEKSSANELNATKSKGNSKKEQKKKKIDSDVVVEESSANGLNAAKSKNNSKKEHEKKKIDSDILVEESSANGLNATKSKGNSKKEQNKKKADSDVVIEESSANGLKAEKSKDNTEKVKDKKKKDNGIVAETEISKESIEIENSYKEESGNKKSRGKNTKQKNNTDLSESKNAIAIDQAAKNNLEKGVVFTVNNILFDFAKSNLKKSSYKELNKVVKLMKENQSVKIELSAHTDNVGPDKYNLSLSKARAKSSKKYLISKGISSKRISSKGYGERKPITSNKTAKGRKQNRRVEIKITSNK